MKHRVSFVHCPNPVYAAAQNNGVIFMPVWMYTLAAHLDSDLYDFELYDTRLVKVSQIQAAEVFLFTGINQDFPTLVSVHADLKRRYPEARTILGGPITWSYEQAGDLDKLSFFDQVVIGDGEEIIAEIVARAVSGIPLEPVYKSPRRLEIANARPLFRPLLDRTIGQYYGAVLEVSRGCPFLCEFCDIRVLPDNNRSHNKAPQLVAGELAYLYDKGVRTFLLACDNFIGEPRWAEQVVGEILAWRRRTGATPVLYTWLTINLYKMTGLMQKMRHAGFDVVFIGVESFNSNSLLETAKVQNTAAGVVGAVRDIQSFGFSVIAGLIFGFDSDGDDCFDLTLDGILESGLLSGDPSFLTALAGTPLYQRMSLAGRLRDVRYGAPRYDTWVALTRTD